MATTIGTIELIAKIDTSQYKKGASDIEKTNNQIEKSTENASSKSGKAWSSGAAVATAAILAAGAVITKTFVNSASEIQSLRASFESLTGNVSDTNSVMTDLYELGKKTAFSNKDIQTAGRSYLAAGVSVEGLGEVLKNTADIAGATGADLGQLTLPLTQTIARGKLQTQDFYQILNSGAGALRKPLTELAGKKGFGSLADALEAGAITSQDLLTVMSDVTKEGGFAFQGAIKQSETFNGRMSNLKEAITNVGLGILGVDAVTGQVDPAGPFAKLSTAVSTATTFLSENEEVIKQVGTVIGIFLIPAIIRLGVESMIAGARIAASMLLALGPIGLIIAAVTAAVYLIIRNWDTLKSWLSTFWNWIKNTAAAAWNAITTAVSNVIEWVKANWPLLLGILLGPVATAIGLIITQWDTVKAALGIFWNWLKTSASSAWEAVKGVFSGVGNFFSNIWNTIVGKFKDVGTSVGNAIGSSFKNVINAVLRGAVNIINNFIRSINAAIDVINKIPKVNVGKLSELNVPQLAEGGVVSAPTLAMIGEGREPEAVVPLSKLDKMINQGGGGGNITINLDGVMARSTSDLRDIAKELVGLIDQERAAQNKPLIMGAR